jgi:hypothetical protein
MNTCIKIQGIPIPCTIDKKNGEREKVNQLTAAGNDVFLYNLTTDPPMNLQEKRIGEWTYIMDPKGKDRRKMSMVKYEKERRKALNLSIISLECQKLVREQGGGRMQRRRKRKKKRTQKRRRKKRKRRTRR